MMHDLFLLYWALLTCTALYATARGAAPERLAIASLVLGSLLTYLTTLDKTVSYRAVETGPMIADLIEGIVFLWLAVRANRRWPQFCAALQLVTLAGHLARLIEPRMSVWTYALMTGFWSWPIMFAIAVGVFRHQRRLRRLEIDQSWSI